MKAGTQATVVAGDGSATPVAGIALVKYLRGYESLSDAAELADPDVSVAR